MTFLRFGTFHKIEDGKITATYVYLGLAELIIALGLWPVSVSQGYAGVTPGPAYHDGVLIENSKTDTSRTSADLVDDMLKRQATKDVRWKP